MLLPDPLFSGMSIGVSPRAPVPSPSVSEVVKRRLDRALVDVEKLKVEMVHFERMVRQLEKEKKELLEAVYLLKEMVECRQ